MNFSLIASLFALCASFATAFNTKNAQLASAPPVRDVKKGRKRPIKEHYGKPTRDYSSSTPVSSPIPSSLQIASSVHDASKVCTRKLESIIYSPPNNVKAYLAKIAAEIRTDIKLIMAAFAAGNLDYIRTYVIKYHILITVSGPYGSTVLVAPNFNADNVPFQSVSWAQTFTGREGFYNDPSNQYYNYQFSLTSTDGQYITFVLSLPLNVMTLSPTECNK